MSFGIAFVFASCFVLLLREPWFGEHQIFSFFIGLISSMGFAAGFFQLVSRSHEYLAITPTQVIGRHGEAIPISAIESVRVRGRAPYWLSVKSADRSISVGGVGIALKTLQSARDELVKRCTKLGNNVQADIPLPQLSNTAIAKIALTYLLFLVIVVGTIIWLGLNR